MGTEMKKDQCRSLFAVRCFTTQKHIRFVKEAGGFQFQQSLCGQRASAANRQKCLFCFPLGFVILTVGSVQLQFEQGLICSEVLNKEHTCRVGLGEHVFTMVSMFEVWFD